MRRPLIAPLLAFLVVAYLTMGVVAAPSGMVYLPFVWDSSVGPKPTSMHTPTPTSTATSTSTGMPTVTNTSTPVPSATERLHGTPETIGITYNPEQTPIPATFYNTANGRAQFWQHNRVSAYFGLLALEEWGVAVQAQPNEVVIGVTPVTGGGETFQAGAYGEYRWPAWGAGRRTARFVIATVTPGGPPVPSPTPTATPAFTGMWEPPQAQPDLSRAAWTYTSTQFLDLFWEPLREAHPDLVTREVIGWDASGSHDLYAYVIMPPTYEKTVIVTANLHGDETFGQIVLHRLLSHVLNDYEGSPHLAYLHERVRFVVVPMVNPWGVDQPGRHRTNANGVDLNRNSGYLWERYEGALGTTVYKGQSAFSEPEVQALKRLFDAYSDADMYFDLHAGADMPHFRAYLPIGDPTEGVVLQRVVDALALPGDTRDVYQFSWPSATNYAAARYGMLTLLPEFSAGMRGGNVYGSIDLYHALRWYGNLIIQYATWEP